MFNFDKSSITLLSVVVCLLVCFYLYRENQKNKTEFSTFAVKVASQLSNRERVPVNDEKKPVVPTPPIKKAKIVSTQKEESDGEESD
jgi:hypothetical protein